MTTNNESPLHHAEESDDGFWRNSDEEALHVSASDLERHAYCPLSWQLARKGKPGRGEAVQAGRVAHAEIHRRVEDFKNKQFDLRRALVIWSWWFTIILVIIADCIIFSTLDDEIRPPIDMAKFLTMLAVSWLGVGLLAIYFPWRQWVNFPTDVEKYKSKIENMNEIIIEPTLQPPGFIGGWSQGGRVEAGLLLGAITFGIHAIGLTWAENKENAAFILIIMATFWTLLASWQLQKALLADNALEIARLEAGLENNVDVAYSDDESTAGLLVDNETGLRGRPDQIVIVDGEFIPVEQKTGKIPNKPHKSHEIQLLAYISLVASTTGRAPPYGVLRYGPESIHTIQWNEKSRSRLMASTKEIQRLMVQGGAERNHSRKGKCANCSRRYACDSSLV